MTNSEFWAELVARNCGRTDPLRHRNKLALLLAGIAGLRESELTLITIGLFVVNWRTEGVCCAAGADNAGWV
jgi:hypothetical protein